MAFYFGCDISLYISFTTQYTSYLILMALFGGAVYIWVLVSRTSLDNLITPIIAFLMSIWVTFFYEKWRKREAEHAFIWSTSMYEHNEQMRVDYIGDYIIDPVHKHITKKSKLSTKTRRHIVN